MKTTITPVGASNNVFLADIPTAAIAQPIIRTNANDDWEVNRAGFAFFTSTQTGALTISYERDDVKKYNNTLKRSMNQYLAATKDDYQMLLRCEATKSYVIFGALAVSVQNVLLSRKSKEEQDRDPDFIKLRKIVCFAESIFGNTWHHKLIVIDQ